MRFLQASWLTLTSLCLGYTFDVPNLPAALETPRTHTLDATFNSSESVLISDNQVQLIDVHWGENIRPNDAYLALLEGVAWVTQFGYLSETGGVDIPFGTMDLDDYGLQLKISNLNGRNDLKYLVIGNVFLLVAQMMTETRNFRAIRANVASGRRLCARVELRTKAPRLGAASAATTRDSRHDSWTKRASRILERKPRFEYPTDNHFRNFKRASTQLLPPKSSMNISQPPLLINDMYIHCRTQYLPNARTLLSKDVFLGIMQNMVNTMPTNVRARVSPFGYASPDHNMILKFTSAGPDPRHNPLISMGMIITIQRVMAKAMVLDRRFAEMRVTVHEINNDRFLGFGEVVRQR